LNVLNNLPIMENWISSADDDTIAKYGRFIHLLKTEPPCISFRHDIHYVISYLAILIPLWSRVMEDNDLCTEHSTPP